jgi:hypothetical protein
MMRSDVVMITQPDLDIFTSSKLERGNNDSFSKGVTVLRCWSSTKSERTTRYRCSHHEGPQHQVPSSLLLLFVTLDVTPNTRVSVGETRVVVRRGPNVAAKCRPQPSGNYQLGSQSRPTLPPSSPQYQSLSEYRRWSSAVCSGEGTTPCELPVIHKMAVHLFPEIQSSHQTSINQPVKT